MPKTSTGFLAQLRQQVPYVLTFAGQSTPWREALSDAAQDPRCKNELANLIARSDVIVSPVSKEMAIIGPEARDLLSPTAPATSGAAADAEAITSVPGILLAQYAALLELADAGLDPREIRPEAVLGHSQGLLAVELYHAWVAGNEDALVEIFTLARLIGAAATRTTRREELGRDGKETPMLSVRGVNRGELGDVLAEMTGLKRKVAIGVNNERATHVLTGAPADLAQVIAACDEISAHQHAELAARTRGGAAFSPVFEFLNVAVPFHSPLLQPAAQQAIEWAALCGLDAQLTERLAHAILTKPFDWTAQLTAALETGAQWILDLGPGATTVRITERNVAGKGVGVVDAGTAAARDEVTTPGYQATRSANWADFAPRLLELPTGKTVVETAFTRLTGRSPVLLAGMTPTTVDPRIVAAAANAGHWAEMAGGGQVTEPVYAQNLKGLKRMLEPGRAAQFNTMFFDRYLWNLQFGVKRIVPRSRAAGAPLDGVCISAGIPDVDEAQELIANLSAEGFPYVAFKPGTVDQILKSVAIAKAAPDFPVILQVEDGHAGGHHSWEDLDDLLLATYATIRETRNIVLCVGGGIGTPERAADFISGDWSLIHDQRRRPVDGVLVGTAAMTCLEATTTKEVKELLVATKGVAPLDGRKGWVGSGESRGGMTSGLSHLRADMYEIDNSSAACSRLIAQVEGDPKALRARRPEIIAALNRTAKPFFGELDTMTYAQWASRFLELCYPWVDESWTDRYYDLLRRIEARLCDQDHGKIVSLFPTLADVADGEAALAKLLAAYPQAHDTELTPIDAAWFIGLCRKHPRPIPFVPAIDDDILRWWGADSLWQAQDPRYPADAVRVIPGPVSVAGIDRIDEPIGELLGRFEVSCVSRVAANGAPTLPAFTRMNLTDGDPINDGITFLKTVPHIMWVGHLINNPALLLEEDQYEIVEVDAQLRKYEMRIKLDTYWDNDPTGETKHAVRKLMIPLNLPDSVAEGGAPVVDYDRLPEQMYGLLAGTAGVGGSSITGDEITALPVMQPAADSEFGEAHWTFTFGPHLGSDHAAVTANALPNDLTPAAIVPDALLGQCWPAIYAALGSAIRDEYPVIEGLLNAVHLDHLEDLKISLEDMVEQSCDHITVRARTTDLLESSSGRVVVVRLSLHAPGGAHIAEFVERFAIRGRVTTDTPPPETPIAGGGERDIEKTPRSLLRRVNIAAPGDMTPFAIVSGDYNPIHTSTNAARVAGMEAPLVHGMWLSAAAQHIVSATDEAGKSNVITGWTYSMFGPVDLNSPIEVTVERIGRVGGGGLLLEVTCRLNKEIVSRATATTAPVATAYVYPGQGIQRPGMGLDERAKSPAVAEIWRRADVHTRKALGFSILAVVRDNPKVLAVRGTTYIHPEGVLNLTQFTQVALATLAFAQTARLREADALVDGAYFAGHSLGEYNALSAYAEIIPLETVLELVFHRGRTMHELVERDDEGRSNYQMGALRPNQFGVSADKVGDYVAQVAAESGEFLEIVNYNLAGQQYAIAGTPAGLQALAVDSQRRTAEHGGKGPFMLVPGVDVPFHSSVLRNGVPEFREKLTALLPERIAYEGLVDKYIPNLVARPFRLEPDFVHAMLEVVPSKRLAKLVSSEEAWAEAAENPADLARLLLIELLAWQFASPVRWIETQEFLFAPTMYGESAVQDFVEIGLGSAPTLANIADKTLKLPEFANADITVYNLQRDEALVYRTDVATIAEDPVEDEPAAAPATAAPGAAAAPAEAAPAAAAPAAPAASAPVATGGPRPEDLPFLAADGVRVLLAYANKIRMDQIGDADTTESLTNGVSSRRNQLLMDMSSEVNLASIDGAAEADVAALSKTVNRMAHNYKPFGPVLSEALRDRVRKLFGPSGVKQTRIAERVRDTWQLGEGWGSFVTAEILLGTREGASVRGGDLASLSAATPGSAGEVDALIDAAVQAVAQSRGISVSMPSGGGGGGGAMVDSAALAEITGEITGADGVLARTARNLLADLGLAEVAETPAEDDAAAQQRLVAAVTAELGPNWEQLVTPSFDAKQAVLLDDRWASAREDLARLYLTGNLGDTEPVFAGAGGEVGAQARWWEQRCRDENRGELAEQFARIAAEAVTAPAEDAAATRFATDVAVITGMTPASIGGAVAAGLLAGGATVVATASRVDAKRLAFAKKLYRENAAPGAKLWLVPANLSSYRDIDDLVAWIGHAQVKTAGGATTEIKPELLPTLFFPFAAPRVMGTAAEAGPLLENQMRLLLWSVERSMTALAALHVDTAVDHRLHVVLPGSPNRGTFGGDGSYGESKVSFDALATRWKVERNWANRVTIAHPRIGWVRGTGLMGGNDPLVQAVERIGVRTFSTPEIATELLALCDPQKRAEAAQAPLSVDLTGGLGERVLDMSALRDEAMAEIAAQDKGENQEGEAEAPGARVAALPSPGHNAMPLVSPDTWGKVTARPEDTVVIVGLGEVGPWGSARTRLEAELGLQTDGSVELTSAGVLELAWMMGLLTWEDTPVSGWYDKSGELVDEADILARYRDEVAARSGIRTFADDGPLQDLASEEDVAIFLNRDVTFTVADEATARSYAEWEPKLTRVRYDEAAGEWEVTRLAGSEVRVPRKATLTRTVGGQFPTDFDPARWGIPASLMESLDRMAVWNLVTAVDAFLSAGFTPAELLQNVHPTEIASTQGTGFGGMASMRKLFVDRFLGEDRPQDILQETLPNVIAAHVMQTYIGGYGGMVHPVGACATAAVSVEEGIDKITCGKASFVVAGAIDDISVESLVGFGDMNATAVSADMAAQGINERFYSRANDRRRGGFIEAQGGGTVLLARGDLAIEMGLPVLGVVGYAQTFADGSHTSIPAPGIGALAAGRGGRDSRLVRQLGALGVAADDIAVVSKHDTSTNANDPNESELHARLSRAIGRSVGNPLFVISQKTLTGHSKGGACIFQISGLCQLFGSGIIPANRSLDCVDDALANDDYLVWLREPLNLGSRSLIRAGLATSLGFGHISSVLAIVHPAAFQAAIAQAHGAEAAAEWARRANDRLKAGARRRENGMLGHAPLFEPVTGRRFREETEDYRPRDVEAAMLLDPQARLGADGTYPGPANA